MDFFYHGYFSISTYTHLLDILIQPIAFQYMSHVLLLQGCNFSVCVVLCVHCGEVIVGGGVHYINR